jgi:hypothetical protein
MSGIWRFWTACLWSQLLSNWIWGTIFVPLHHHLAVNSRCLVLSSKVIWQTGSWANPDHSQSSWPSSPCWLISASVTITGPCPCVNIDRILSGPSSGGSKSKSKWPWLVLAVSGIILQADLWLQWCGLLSVWLYWELMPFHAQMVLSMYIT